MAQKLPTSSPAELGLDPRVLDEIQPVLARLIDRGRIPGAVVMIARRGQVVYDAAFGHARIEQQIPFQRDTIFRVFSMTKPVTSVAAMMLVEGGQLQLSAPIGDWIPELRDLQGPLGQPTRPITTQDLLTHTAGLTYGSHARHPLDFQYKEAKLLRRESTLDEMARKLSGFPLASQPGEKWHYSIATDVLGLLIERVSGQSLDQFFAERIFQPLGMRDTGFSVPVENVDRFADNYMFGEERKLVLHDPAETSPYLSPPTLFSGGAGLVSTADDFMKFCNLLLGHGNGLLQNDTIERMTSNQLPPELLPIYFAGPRTGLGFGLGVSVVIGRVPLVPSSPLSEYGWGGAASTHFWISPQHQLACIAMTQKMPFTYDLENRVKSIVYRAINA